VAFSESWVETDPDGAIITVSQLDDYQRAAKRQIRERLEGDPANANSGIYEASSFGTTAIVRAGTARLYAVATGGLAALSLQDGRMAVTTDTNRLYHLKGSGMVEVAYMPIDGTRHFTALVTFDAGINVAGAIAGAAINIAGGANIGGPLAASAISATGVVTCANISTGPINAGTIALSGGATISAGGLVVTAGGISVAAGGVSTNVLTVTGAGQIGSVAYKIKGTDADFVITPAMLGTGIFLLSVRNASGAEKGLFLVWSNGATLAWSSVSNTAGAAVVTFNGNIIPSNIGTYTWGVIQLAL
jgi:hypothetical protein